eukprot:403337236
MYEHQEDEKINYEQESALENQIYQQNQFDPMDSNSLNQNRQQNQTTSIGRNTNGGGQRSSQLQQNKSPNQYSVPTHRQNKRPVSILKNKKTHVGLKGTYHHSASQNFWNAISDQPNSNPDSPKVEGHRLAGDTRTGQKTVTQVNFFECREVTNCEFIYEHSDKSSTPRGGNNQGGGIFDTLSRFFTRQSQQAEISAMCALKDLLAIGFSNGVLILFDIDKLDIIFSHKHFTKNDKPIDKLKLFQIDQSTSNTHSDEPINLLLSLSDGFLSYHRFPKIQIVDELLVENNIIDFHPYIVQQTPFLATLHKYPRELKIFRLRSRLEYKYLTKVMLDYVPLGFTVYKDIFLITYRDFSEYLRIDNKGRDVESVTRFTLWQNDEQEQARFNPLPVFDESIQAFVITKEDYSFYMDVKGVYDREFNKIKWSDHVMHVEIVRPYLVGFLPNSIEIKNIFNPNRVVQKIELLQSAICRHAVAQNHICLRELDSMYILLNRKQSNIKVLLKMTQIDPRVQINMLIERKLYSTGLKFYELLLDNNFDGMTKEQYDKLQREKGFYNFIVKRRYYIAKDIFKEYKVPQQQVILLFSEIYPTIFIQKLIEMFDINVKEIPYFDLQKQKELSIFDYHYKGTQGSFASRLGQMANHQNFGISNQENNMYLKNDIDSEKLTAMREFLHYFIKKRNELIKKIEKLSLVEKGIDKFQSSNQVNSDGGANSSLFNPLQFQSDQFNAQLAQQQVGSPPPIIPTGGLSTLRQNLNRRMSFERVNIDEQNNPFDLEIIPDKRYHQSDNENVDQKLSQLYYLRIMTEFFIFHSLILLIKSNEEHDKLVLRNEFYSLLKNDNALPSEFCREVFFHYEMYDEALLFLYYRKDYKELLGLIHREFEQNKSDKKLRNYWLSKMIKYSKKINEQGNEDLAIQSTAWLFDINLDIALECLKKFEKKDPFKSDKIMRFIKDNGGFIGCLKYLEYLTLECGVEDRPIHTELACLYVSYIAIQLDQYTMQSDQQNTGIALNQAPGGQNDQQQQISEGQIDFAKADQDEKIFELREKLMMLFEKSDFFEPQPILEQMPQNYLIKERVILLAKSRRYKEAFTICVDQLQDVEYAMSVAHRAFKWHKDKSIYFYIFAKLLQSNQRDQAMQVLQQNFKFLSFEQVTKHLSENEKFDLNLNQFYAQAFVEMEKVQKELSVMRNLTQYEYFTVAEELYKERNKNIMINEETVCNTCGKKIQQYPFYWVPKSQQIIHYHCFINENREYYKNMAINQQNNSGDQAPSLSNSPNKNEQNIEASS